MTRFRLLFAISTLAVLATALVACGSSSSPSPQDVINQTFSSHNQSVKSANINVKLDVNATGSKPGAITAELSGPFQNNGSGKVPNLDLTAKLNESGAAGNTNFDGSLTVTNDAAFVTYKGTAYQVPSAIFSQLKTAVEQSSTSQSQSGTSPGQLLQKLGISNPKDLLTNLKSDGTADVQGTSTNHVSGDLDVAKFVDDLKSAIAGASALGALGANVPSLPSASQLDQVKSAVKTAHFDLYSGKDDHLLRRITVVLSIAPPSGQAKGVSKVDLSFDLTLGGVNQSQTITAPSGAKPLSALLSQLHLKPGSSLGALGALGGVPGSGIAGAGTPTSPPSGTPTSPSGAPSGASGGASAAQLQKYLKCVQKSSNPTSCQSLLPK